MVNSDHGSIHSAESKAYASIPKSSDDFDSDSDGIHGHDYNNTNANYFNDSENEDNNCYCSSRPVLKKLQRGTNTTGLDSEDEIPNFNTEDYRTKTTGLDSEDDIPYINPEDKTFDLFDSDEDVTNSCCSDKQSAFKRLRRTFMLTGLDVEAKRYVISN